MRNLPVLLIAVLVLVRSILAAVPVHAASQSLVNSDWADFKPDAYTDWTVQLNDTNGNSWIYRVSYRRDSLGQLRLASKLTQMTSGDLCTRSMTEIAGLNGVAASISDRMHSYKVYDTNNRSTKYIKFFKDNASGAVRRARPHAVEIQDPDLGVALYLAPPPPKKYWQILADQGSRNDQSVAYRVQHLKLSSIGNTVNRVGVSSSTSNSFAHMETFGRACGGSYPDCGANGYDKGSLNATYTFGRFHYNYLTYRSGSTYGVLIEADPGGTPQYWGQSADGHGGGSMTLNTSTPVTVRGDACGLPVGTIYNYIAIGSGIAKQRFSAFGNPSYYCDDSNACGANGNIDFHWGAFDDGSGGLTSYSGMAEISERQTCPTLNGSGICQSYQ